MDFKESAGNEDLCLCIPYITYILKGGKQDMSKSGWYSQSH